MEFPIGIKVSEPSDRGSLQSYNFEIIDLNQKAVLLNILEWLTPEKEVFLSDHRRGDSEGGVIVTYRDNKLMFMRGGHGYSSDWIYSSRTEALHELLDAAQMTKWGSLLGHGSISILKEKEKKDQF